jgi:hypothetical protein
MLTLQRLDHMFTSSPLAEASEICSLADASAACHNEQSNWYSSGRIFREPLNLMQQFWHYPKKITLREQELQKHALQSNTHSEPIVSQDASTEYVTLPLNTSQKNYEIEGTKESFTVKLETATTIPVREASGVFSGVDGNTRVELWFTTVVIGDGAKITAYDVSVES